MSDPVVLKDCTDWLGWKVNRSLVSLVLSKSWNNASSFFWLDDRKFIFALSSTYLDFSQYNKNTSVSHINNVLLSDLLRGSVSLGLLLAR